MFTINNRFREFQIKRIQIFGEIVKRYWKGQLQDNENLDQLAEEIKEKFNFFDHDMPFIKDHIRMAMGLNPTGKRDFSEELDLVKQSKAVGEPVISKIEGPCEECDNHDCKCLVECKYESPIYNRSDTCLNCGSFVKECDFGAIADKIEFVPLINLLKDSDTPVFVSVAPAITGQFGDDITMGQLRSAFKQMGFSDMIETAMFADILTIREAFEFSHLVKNKGDFFLTSCCCPVWFNMTRKNYPELFKHMSPSVSPMIASGRFIKSMYEGAKVVFVAPCIAKKAEIKEPELAGAIDFVINFRELEEIFNALEIDLKSLPSDDKDQASMGGRLYARAGGVSFSVKTVVNRLEPKRLVKLKATKVNGVKECKEALKHMASGKDFDFNFIEGMGCVGGCVGGPRTNIDMEKATWMVNDYAEDSLIMTPFDNLNIMKILRQHGLNRIEEVVENEKVNEMLSRKK